MTSFTKETINIGTTANDGTGDSVRVAFNKTNENFTELYNHAESIQADLNQYASNLSTLSVAANNYAGFMANSGNAWTQTIVDANLITARAYTNTSTAAANAYAGAMANSGNTFAATIVDANLITARAYTNTSTAAANNYAGFVAITANTYAATIVDANLVTARAYTNTSTAAANAWANTVGLSANSYAGAMANSGNDYAITVGTAGNAYATTVGTSANSYAGAMANAANAITYTVVAANLVTARAYTNTSTAAANSYAGFMANSGNAWTQTIVDANLVVARTYTNTSTAAANSYAGAMANSINSFASVMDTAGNNYTNAVGLAGNNYASILAANNAIGANGWANTVSASANNYAGFMANSGNAWTQTIVDANLVVARAYTNTSTAAANAWANTVGLSANNYAGFMANSGNAWTQTIVDANLVVARAYTNTSTAAANSYAGFMVNSANTFASTIVDANLVTARAYTNTSTAAANNYAGVMANSANSYAGFMANSANAYAASLAQSSNLTSANAWANTVAVYANNYAGVMANSANAITYTVVAANLVTARAYTNTSTAAANAWANTVAVYANNYAGVMANSGNAYTVTVGASANAWANVISRNWANTRLANVIATSGRTIITWSTTNGYTNATIDLATTAVSPNTYGGASRVPVIAVDSYGRITSASNVDISIINVDDMRSSTPVQNVQIRLAGYYTRGDGGGGTFCGVTGAAAGTYVDNGGTIIVPTGGNGSSAWLRVYEGDINVKWFGAKGDGVTDDTSKINAAFVAANASKKAVYFPGSYYAINGTVNLFNDISFYGDGRNISVFYMGVSGNFYIDNGSDINTPGLITINGLGFTNQGAGTRLSLNLYYIARLNIIDCIFYNVNIALVSCQYVNISLCYMWGGTLTANHPDVDRIAFMLYITSCDTSSFGMDISDTTDFKIQQSSFLGPNASVKVQRGQQPAAFYPVVQISDTVIDSTDNEALTLVGVQFGIVNSFISGGRTNSKDGIYIDDCTESAMTNCDVRYSGRDGLFITNSNNINISNCSFNDNYRNGVSLNNSNNIKFVSCSMINAPAWWGGSYTQQVGITDIATNCTYITCVFCNVVGNAATNMYLPDVTNTIIGNNGYSTNQVLGNFNSLLMVDGVTAPSTTAGVAKIYVDSADGDLKIKFGDGTVKTIVTDT